MILVFCSRQPADLAPTSLTLGYQPSLVIYAASCEKMQRLTMTYHNRHESGELVGRVSHDTNTLQHFN